MTNLNPSYNEFNKFFAKNRQESNSKFQHEITKFEKQFNESIANLRSNKGEQGGIAIAILLRAIKYLFTAHNLLLDGHQEEARILLRNVVELGLIGFMISKSDDVFTLWKACRQLRKENENDGNILTEKIKSKKFRFTEMIKNNKELINSDHRASHLFSFHSNLSEYVSHENLYTMIARIDTDDGKTNVYVGQSAKSENNRLMDDLNRINQLLTILKELKSELE